LVSVATLSDLHLEFDRDIVARGRSRKRSASRKSLEAEGHPAIGPNLSALRGACDVVILAGDVDLGAASLDYAATVQKWLAVPVLLIAGNHEFYHAAHHETLLALRHQAAGLSRVYFLENDRLDLRLRDRWVRFLGCTLWTDFALFGTETRDHALAHAAQAMTDFRGTIAIQEHRRFQPEHALALHHRSRAWLEAELAAEFEGVTVVMTHHAPSYRSVPQQYRRDLLSAAYASDLEVLLQNRGTALWVHGHTHTSMDYVSGSTRVICNPRGYRPYELNKHFDAGLVVAV
jgi:predicted phosphodiesterase